MEKHGWNVDLGLSMLDSYERILPMDRQELTCLYYLFLYPEKYWKQLNFYYNAIRHGYRAGTLINSTVWRNSSSRGITS